MESYTLRVWIFSYIIVLFLPGTSIFDSNLMSTTRIKTGPASPGKPDNLQLHFGRPRRARGTFTIHTFEDHGHHVAYLPSLNLSAYGDSEQEARDRLLSDVIDDFLDHLMDLKPEKITLELQKLGWSRNRMFKKQFKSNSYVDRDGVLKNFNLPKETKVDTRVVAVNE